MTRQDTLRINGREYAFQPGDTLLDAAKKNGLDIPSLCHLARATPTGVCGVCVVELAERPGELVRACMTPAESWMTVRTESPCVVAERKAVIKRFLDSGFHNCAVRGADSQDWTSFQMAVQASDGADDLCPAWGDCQLQELAYRYQVCGDHFPREGEYPRQSVNPFIFRDYARCIQCGRCVQACNEIQVNMAIDASMRDENSKVTPLTDFPLANEDCVFCGECIQACPVGALVEKGSRYTVRPWETTRVRTTCSYCGVGCQLWLHVKDNKVVKVTGVEEVGPNYGSLCVKGRFGFHFVSHPDRLTTPLIKEGDGFREASWDEALDLVAKRLGELKETKGPDKLGVLTSARVTNEENYIAQKFSRAVLKTNNVDHCARL